MAKRPNKKPAKLKFFVGSSSEHEKAGRMVASWVKAAGGKPVFWKTPGVFPKGSIVVDELVRLTRECVGSFFVLAEDDRLRSRGRQVPATRDNVLIEFGMFIAAQGRAKAIGCQLGKPHNPIDLAGLTYVNIPSGFGRTTRELTLARKEVRSHVKKVLGNPTFTDEFTGQDKYESLRNRSNRAVENVAEQDVIERTLAQDIVRRVSEKDPVPHVLSAERELEIDADGSLKSTYRQTLFADDKPLYYTTHYFSGEVGIEDFADLRFKIRSITKATHAYVKVAIDKPRMRKLVVLFEPPIKPGSSRRIEISHCWPRVFPHLPQNREDGWLEGVASAVPVKKLKLSFTFHRKYKGLDLSNPREVEGARFLPVAPQDQHGRHRWVWEMRNVPGKSDLNFLMNWRNRR